MADGGRLRGMRSRLPQALRSSGAPPTTSVAEITSLDSSAGALSAEGLNAEAGTGISLVAESGDGQGVLPARAGAGAGAASLADLSSAASRTQPDASADADGSRAGGSKRKARAGSGGALEEPLSAASEGQRTVLQLMRDHQTGKRMRAASDSVRGRRKGAIPAVPAPRLPEPAAEETEPVGGGVIAPKLQIVDGKLVLDKASLVVVASAGSVQPGEFSLVHEASQRVSSASFARRLPSERWSPADTDRFFAALQLYGTDFSLVETLFPGRERRQLKNKFKREERLQPGRLEAALRAAARSSDAERQALIAQLRLPAAEGAAGPASGQRTVPAGATA